MKVQRNILNSEQIKQINDATLIIRHFVDLSARLLPFLAELQSKENLSEKEQEDKNKIITVFNTYNFDTTTSDILMNSPILELVKNTYRKILTCNSKLVELEMELFNTEYHRLKSNWKYAVSN